LSCSLAILITFCLGNDGDTLRIRQESRRIVFRELFYISFRLFLSLSIPLNWIYTFAREGNLSKIPKRYRQYFPYRSFSLNCDWFLTFCDIMMSRLSHINWASHDIKFYWLAIPILFGQCKIN
jgi:hypothetical protein